MQLEYDAVDVLDGDAMMYLLDCDAMMDALDCDARCFDGAVFDEYIRCVRGIY